MINKIVETIKMNQEDRDFLESLYVDYSSKMDVLNNIFEIHKFDSDDSVISSIPFQSYHKRFAECKVKYDEAMKQIAEKYIPSKYDNSTKGYRWEVKFNECMIEISEM